MPADRAAVWAEIDRLLCELFVARDREERVQCAPDPGGPHEVWRWNGAEYALTTPQLAAVRLLRDRLEEGVPDVPQAAAVAGTGAASLRELFRGSPAWMALVVPGARAGAYRLAPRPEDD